MSDTEQNAIAVRDPNAVTARDFSPIFSVQEAVERKRMMNAFIQSVMVEGEDYGKPAYSDRKVLLKPGAEKLCSIFGLSPTYAEDKVIEDWTGVQHGGEPLFYYSYRCQLSRGGRFMGEAIGSCNSWESKYRYRWVPEEVARQRADFESLTKRGGVTNKFEPSFALERKETTGQYGKPAAYWQMFEDGKASGRAKHVSRTLGKKEYTGWEMQMDQTQYRVPNPEIADTVNTVQKMAQKRALVAAVLVVTNCSDPFTQDIEDFAEPESQPAVQPEPKREPKPEPKREPEANGWSGLPSGREIPEALVSRFEAIDHDSKHIAPAFEALAKALQDKAGANGVVAYDRIIKRFRSVTPKGKETKTDIKECLVDLWEELQTAVHPLGELVEQTPESC
jgi:hypothetical protein